MDKPGGQARGRGVSGLTDRHSGAGVHRIRRDRASLLRSTALQAAVLTVIALPAAAQPAPNARPSGGQVVAGSAAISQSNPATTVITQSTNRAAIDWQSFSVGSQQSVDFRQPSSSAMTLNRVTGADPSAIAGRIQANGGVVLTNPNGVVFYKGSQVNAQDVIVSTAGITNQNFMAGRMVFDQPGNPDARIANAGTITVKDTGLAALVAPQVANSGVISARLGHAVLAGAEAATLDMYGDGLLSVDVTKQVTQAPKGKTALVTNTGTVVANGGQVLLTAQAADGVVQNLVAAGGKISANSVGGKTGAIAIEGTGGSIVITGNLSAIGIAAGTTGGSIEMVADKAVTIAGRARVNASGAAGGGTVAVGTSLARAVGGPSVTAPTAAVTTIAKGARVLANATKSGNGGRVTVLSTQATAMNGTIQAKGGPTAGNGGTVEISTGGALTMNGSVDVSAPHGLLGDIVIDPYDLDISALFSTGTLTNGTNPNLAYNTPPTAIGNVTTITPAQIEALNGNVHLQTIDDIDVQSSVTLTTVGQGLTLEAGNNLTVSGGVTISTAGSIALLASSTLIPGFVTTGTLEMLGSVVSTGGNVLLQGGSGGVIVAGEVAAPAAGLVDLKGDVVSILTSTQSTPIGGLGGFVSVPGGQLTIEPYTAGHPIELVGSLSTATAGSLSVSTTELQLVNAATLALGGATTISGTINIGKTADAVSLGTIGQLSLFASTVTEGAPLIVGTLSGQTGTTTLLNTGNQIGTISNFSANALSLQDAIALTFAGSDLIAGNAAIGDTVSVAVNGELGVVGTLSLNVAGAVTEGTGGSIVDLGNTLTLTGSVGALALGNGNSIDALGSLTATTGGISVADAQPLTIAGPVTATLFAVTIADTGGGISILGNLTGATVNLGSTGTIAQSGGILTATTLFAAGTAVSLVGANSVATIGSLIATTGSIAFSDQVGVAIAGPVTAAGAISLSTAGALTIGATLTTPGLLSLAADGSIVEGPGGIIVAGTLGGNSAAPTSLANLNEVSSIGTFASTGGFILNQDTTALTVAGALSDSTSISLSTQGQILLVGTLSAPTVSLTTTETLPSLNSGTTPVTAGQLATIESIIQSGGGITADVLNINSAAGVNMLPGTSNSISNLGTITVQSLFNLNNQTSITIAGPAVINGPTINAGSGNDFYYQFYVNTPDDLVVSAPITGAVVGLFAGGNLTETAGGAITTGFLQGSGGSVSLTQAANAIGEIDLLTSTTNLAVSDGIPLLVNGAVSAGTGNTLIINNDSLSLGASAAISAPGGTVQLAPLNPGDAFTIGNASSITTLTAITADTLVIGSTTAGQVTVNASSSNFDASSVGTLALVSGASVAEIGPNGIIANVLTGNVVDNVSLSGANRITTLGSFTTGSQFFLSNANPGGAALTITGPVTASVASITSTTGPIVVAGSIVADEVVLDTTGTTTGGISETASGVIATNALDVFVSSASPASLTGANAVTGIDGVTVGTGGFTLSNAIALNVDGEGGISSTGPVVLQVSGSLGISSPISGTALDLIATGSIAESVGAALSGTSLTGSASAANFGQAGNAIGTLGAFTSTGGFTLLDGGGLTVAGPVTDATQVAIGAGSIAVTGALTAPLVGLSTTTGAITLAGNIAASSEIALTSAGSVTQGGGGVSSPLLTGSSGGTVALNGANTIAAIGSFTAGGSFSLADTGPLQVSGVLTAASVNLVASGAIGEGTTAALITGLLTGSGTSVSLPAATNQIAGLGSFATTTGLALTDAVPVTVSGTVSTGNGHVISISDGSIGFSAGGALIAPGGTIVLEPATGGAALTLGGTGGAVTTANEVLIDTSGAVSITGPLDFAGVTTVLLVAGGSVSETASGAIVAPLLTGAAASAALGGPNTIAALGSFTTSGPFALNDTANLTLTGVLSTPSATVVSGGTITEASGALITAGTLAGSANTALLTGANTIATLGAFTAGTGLFLTDDTSLVVSGPVGGGALTAIAASGSLTVGGTITGTSVSLAAATALTESGGAINVGTLAASGASVTLLGSNSIANLGNVSAAGGLQLADAGALTIGGSIAAGPFASFSGGGVSEAAGGSVAAGTLTVAVASLALGGSNTVGTLGVASAPGGLLLSDAESLVVSGPAGSSVAAVTSLITTAGSITIAGSLSGGTVNLVSGGAANESGAGLINAGTLSGSFAAALLGGVNTVAALGSITTPSTLSLTESGSLNVAGAVTAPAVVLNLGGALTESTASLITGSSAVSQGPGGALITGSLAATAAGGISLGGANQITSIASLSSPGGVSVTNAIDLGLAGPISGSSVNLASSGALTQTAGTITTALLTGSAGGSAGLTDRNAVGTLGAFSAGGVLSLIDGSGLTVAGPVSTAGLSLTAAGPIAITGNISTGTFSVSAAGSIVQSAGVITAALLVGNATGEAVFGPDAAGPVANIAQLGGFTVTGGTVTAGTATGGTLAVASGQAMTVSGPINASSIALSAAGTITLAGGTIATTTGTIAATGGTTGAIVQTGTTDIVPLSTQFPVLTLALPGAGTISLNDFSAPAATLQLNTGSGTANGLVNVAALAISGQGGAASLSGAVADNATPTAALLATIAPTVNTNYTLNGCVIMAASCAVVVPPPPPPPPPPPLAPQQPSGADQVVESIVLPPNSGVSIVPDILDSTAAAADARSAFRIPFLSGLLAYVFSRDVDDPDLVLPNISDRDY